MLVYYPLWMMFSSIFPTYTVGTKGGIPLALFGFIDLNN